MGNQQNTKETLTFKGVSKSFGSHTVLHDVNFVAQPGQVIALMGENGAGKSTLMRILCGVYPSHTYGGEILWGNEPLTFTSVQQAKARGIAMIHQELGLFPQLTVTENIFLDEWTGLKSLFIPWSKAHKKSSAFLSELGFNVPTQQTVENLSTGQAQLVEIARAIRANAKIIIMDEPTSALTDTEAHALFKLIAELKAQGRIIFYVSHRMNEIKLVTDRVIVLRDGQIAGQGDTATTDQPNLIRWMVGRDVNTLYPAAVATTAPQTTALVVKDLALKKISTGKVAVGPCSFKLNAGEVLGFAGLMGAGRSELMHGLYGSYSQHAPHQNTYTVSGEVNINGRTLPPERTPSLSLQNGLALLTEDRKHLGLFLNRPATENMTISVLKNLLVSATLPLPLISPSKEQNLTDELARSLHIRGPSLTADAETYSGGNQQKVYLAKLLALQPRVLILDEPTRGVDVGAKSEIYTLIRKLASAGVGIILISSEMPELLGLSDRVIVLREGQISEEFSRSSYENNTYNPEHIMKAASL